MLERKGKGLLFLDCIRLYLSAVMIQKMMRLVVGKENAVLLCFAGWQSKSGTFVRFHGTWPSAMQQRGNSWRHTFLCRWSFLIFGKKQTSNGWLDTSRNQELLRTKKMFSSPLTKRWLTINPVDKVSIKSGLRGSLWGEEEGRENWSATERTDL